MWQLVLLGFGACLNQVVKSTLVGVLAKWEMDIPNRSECGQVTYSYVKGLRWFCSGEENTKEQQDREEGKGNKYLGDYDTGLLLVEVVWNLGFLWTMNFGIHILCTNLCMPLSYLNQPLMAWCEVKMCVYIEVLQSANILV